MHQTTKAKILAKAETFGILTETENLFNNAENAVFTTKGKATKLFGFSYLMGVNSSTKIQKNVSKGYMSGVLYLAAADNVGVNICPKATEGCAKACLFFSGRASMISKGKTISNVNKSRFLKTALFFANRSFFNDWIFTEIANLEKLANKKGFIPSVRLNGTADINLKTFKNSDGVNVLDKFSNIQFYDYTKVESQFKNTQPNYDITFSFGGFANLMEVFDAVLDGKRISVPFAKETFSGQFPATFLGMEIYDGDQTDLTFLTPSEYQVYGLKVKLPIGTKIDLSNDFFVTKERQIVIEKMFAEYKKSKLQTA